MKSGVIADFDITEAMISYFINKVCPKRFWSKYVKPRVVIAVPGDITEVEKRAVEDAAHAAGVGEVFLVEEPMAAAIGVGLPVSEPAGSMIVDIGGGTCEVAIISLTGIVHARSVRSAGDAMDACIVSHMRRVYNLLIGERTAESIKMTIGSAFPTGQEKTMEVHALRDRLVLAESSALFEHLIDQRRLAVVDVGDDGDVPQIVYAHVVPLSSIHIQTARVCGPPSDTTLSGNNEPFTENSFILAILD